MELAGAALVGVVSGAVVGATSSRVVNNALDAAVHTVGQVSRGVANFDDYRLAFPEIFEELEGLDVDARLRIVLSLLNNADRRERTTAKGEETIDVCLSEVRSSVDSIAQGLEAIHRELREHRTRWFAAFRSPSVDGLLRSLRVRMGVLDKRVDMLIKAQAFLDASRASAVALAAVAAASSPSPALDWSAVSQGGVPASPLALSSSSSLVPPRS